MVGMAQQRCLVLKVRSAGIGSISDTQANCLLWQISPMYLGSNVLIKLMEDTSSWSYILSIFQLFPKAPLQNMQTRFWMTLGLTNTMYKRCFVISSIISNVIALFIAETRHFFMFYWWTINLQYQLCCRFLSQRVLFLSLTSCAMQFLPAGCHTCRSIFINSWWMVSQCKINRLCAIHTCLT